MRIASHPVRRSASDLPTIRSIGPVEAHVDERWIDGESVIVRAVFPLPNGSMGAVERTEAGEWHAAAGAGGWLPEAFELLHDALEAALLAATKELDEEVPDHV
jgi:hypothetical protein